MEEVGELELRINTEGVRHTQSCRCSGHSQHATLHMICGEPWRQNQRATELRVDAQTFHVSTGRPDASVYFQKPRPGMCHWLWLCISTIATPQQLDFHHQLAAVPWAAAPC